MISRRLGLKFAFEELELSNSDSINFNAQMPQGRSETKSLKQSGVVPNRYGDKRFALSPIL
jgi:hypothetical protein